MSSLGERLLSDYESSNFLLPKNTDNAKNRNRLTLINQRKNLNIEDSLQFESWQNKKKMYHSIIEQPDFAWNSEQIMERSMIMEEVQKQQRNQNAQILKSIPNSVSTATKQSISSSLKKSSYQENFNENKKKKQLNSRIFYIKDRPMAFIYYFNFFFNILFRLGLVVLLVQLLVKGDGDPNKNQELIFIAVLLGLEGLVFLLYFLAITKMLYTKSSDISVYFQKQFYEKPYAQIHMQRILRKHFTIKKIVSNLTKLANPCTKFSKDLKIAVMRQQIYKRIQIIIVYLPLAVAFISVSHFFSNNQTGVNTFNVPLLMAIVVCIETVRLTFHYIFVYIFS